MTARDLLVRLEGLSAAELDLPLRAVRVSVKHGKRLYYVNRLGERAVDGPGLPLFYMPLEIER